MGKLLKFEPRPTPDLEPTEVAKVIIEAYNQAKVDQLKAEDSDQIQPGENMYHELEVNEDES